MKINYPKPLFSSLHQRKISKIWSLFLTLLLLFTGDVLHAQVANYAFSQAGGTYSPIAGSVVRAANWDDQAPVNVAIPFTFIFNGANYNSCFVNCNGYITFGATSAAANFTPISAATAFAGAVSAFGRDIRSNGLPITSAVIGVAPNRTFIVQWENVRRYQTAVRDADFNFQIRLNESSNVIQVMYGACATTYTTDLFAQVGLRGATNADFNNRLVTNNWPASTAGAVNNATCTTGTDPGELPPSGLTYTWTPRPVISGIAPASLCDGSGGTVLINGTNLAGATVVFFNGIAAVSSVNAAYTQITATLPSGATTGAITVTTPGGTANTATFTVNPQPVASPITGITSICPATTTTLSDATPGGVWSSSNTGVATISAGGVVSALTAGGTTISYTVTSGSCNAVATVPFTVYPTPVLSGPTSGCTGGSGIVFSSSTGTGTWVSNNNSIATIDNSGNVNAIATGSTTFIFTDSVTGCTATTAAFNVIVPPVITSQPVATQTVCNGDPVSLSISANGGSLSFQWYKGATPLSNGGNISGTNTDTLNFVPIGTADAAPNYHCVVTNACTSLDSSLAEVLVNLKPIIFARSVSACSGIAFTESPVDGVPTSATVVPASTTYSWPAPVVTGGLTGGSAQSGQSDISATLTNPTNTAQTATYTVTPVSGTSGNCIGNPFTVTVTVAPVPDINNLTPVTCSGDTFSVTPANGGGNIVPAGTTFSWSAPAVTGGLTGGTAQSGQTSISQTLTNSTNAVQTATYNITATAGSCLGSTFTIVVTVNPKPTVAGAPATQTACSGIAITPIVLSNPNSVPGVSTYNWTRDNLVNLTGIGGSGNGNISGTLTNNTGIPQTTIFTIYATSEEGCVSVSSTVSVTVEPVAVPAAAPASQSVCSGIGITQVNFSSANGVPITTYNWVRNNTVNLTGIPDNGTGTSVSGTLVNNTNATQITTFTVTAVVSGCATNTTTFSITVKPQPTIAATTSTPIICSSSSFAINVTNPNSVAGTTFSYVKDNPSVTGSGIVLSGNSLTGTLTNTTTIDQTVTFTLTATAGGCLSTTTVQVLVHPSPNVVAPATLAICNNGNLTLNFSGTAGTTYTWSWVGPNVTGTPVLSGNTISGIFTNNTTVNQTATFTIVGTLNGCTSTAITVVTVYPQFTTAVIADSQTVCAGARPTPIIITTLPSGGAAGYTYQWQTAPDFMGPWTNIGGATAASYWPPTTNAATPQAFYQLIISNPCGTVTSNFVSISVVNNVNFAFSLSGNAGTSCPNIAFNPTITSLEFFPDSYIRYSWVADVNYISPTTGGPIGTTNIIYFLGIPIAAISTATLPLTTINNTNASVTTTVFITPNIYDASSNAFICSLSPQSTSITIYPRPVATAITVPASAICSGTSAGIVIDGNITSSTMSFNWSRTDGNANVTSSQASGSALNLSHPNNFFTIPDVLTNTSGSLQAVTYTITPSSPNCTGAPITVTVNVNPLVTPGVIAANQTICSGGDPAAFTQTTPASGGGVLTYQWQSSTTGLAGSYANIAGATGVTYDPPSGLTVTTWYIRTVTSTVSGVSCSIATTTPVKVTINTIVPGSITAGQTLCNGAGATITSVNATGSGIITYQWQSNITGCAGTWSDIPGATNPTLIVSGLTQTTYYRRIAISTLNGVSCSDYSNCVTITINDVTAGTVGSDQTLCGNNPDAFTEITPSTGSGSLTYQWQSNTTGCGGVWTNIGGATSIIYDPPAGFSITTYYHRVTTSTLNGVSCTATSNCITVSPNPVTGGTISGNRTVCNGGDPIAFTSTTPGTGIGLTYQWQSSTTGGGGPWTDIPTATGATYDAPGPVTQTTYYQRVALGTVGPTTCQAVSNFVTVFVNDVTASTVAGDQALCGTSDPVAFTVTTPATANGTLTYQWQSSTTGCAGPWANIALATSATYDPPALLQTTYYHVIAISTINGVQCTATSNCITVNAFSKTWNGSVSADWNTAANWTPNGVPTSSHCVVIPNVTTDPIISGSGYIAYAKNLSILSGGRLDVNPNNSIVVTDEVNVNALGNFFITSTASLVQVNNTVNTGNVVMLRITAPMYRFDYTYWNSPVTLASNYTLGALSPNTQVDKYYSWNPSVANGNGNWIQESIATVMNPTKGYIVRAPNSFSFNPAITQTYTATFIGVPNNGDIPIPIRIGTLGPGTTNDKLNLIGNPYASAVDADLFLGDPTNTPLIDGTIYFWTHHAPPSAAFPNPFYGTFALNYSPAGYASYNTLGGTNTVPAGFGGTPPNGYIASGQSFFVTGLGTGTAMFRNNMRVTGNNNVFFRTTNPYTSAQPMVEKHRIWLNLADTQGSFSQILVGYAAGATNDFDRGFDGEFFNINAVSLYSINSGKNLGIQGRALPFDENDQVPLGYNSTVDREFTIGIDHVDGIFSNHGIYLEDKLLNIIFDIRQSPYSFNSSIGTFNDRFALRFTNSSLGVDNPDMSSSIKAFINERKLFIEAGQGIVNVKIFDISGKLIRTFIPEQISHHFEEEFAFPEGIYFAKIKLEDGILHDSKLSNTEK